MNVFVVPLFLSIHQELLNLTKDIIISIAKYLRYVFFLLCHARLHKGSTATTSTNTIFIGTLAFALKAISSMRAAHLPPTPPHHSATH